jgi:hypothetical protein
MQENTIIINNILYKKKVIFQICIRYIVIEDIGGEK